MKTVLCLTLVLLLLAGCGARQEVSGTVVGTKHTEAYTTTRMQPVMIGRNMSAIPITTRHPEQWYLAVTDDQGRTLQISVTKEAHDSAKVGDLYP